MNVDFTVFFIRDEKDRATQTALKALRASAAYVSDDKLAGPNHSWRFTVTQTRADGFQELCYGLKAVEHISRNRAQED